MEFGKSDEKSFRNLRQAKTENPSISHHHQMTRNKINALNHLISLTQLGFCYSFKITKPTSLPKFGPGAVCGGRLGATLEISGTSAGATESVGKLVTVA